MAGILPGPEAAGRVREGGQFDIAKDKGCRSQGNQRWLMSPASPQRAEACLTEENPQRENSPQAGGPWLLSLPT